MVLSLFCVRLYHFWMVACKAYLETNGFGGYFWQREHPTISKHYPANMSCQSCYLDLTPNSRYQFTRKYVAARGEN